jgi:hypothetical protein
LMSQPVLQPPETPMSSFKQMSVRSFT